MLSALPLLLLAVSAFSTVNAQCLKDLSWIHKPEVKEGGMDSRVIYNGFQRPRGIRFLGDTLLVVDAGVGIVALRENQDGCDGGWTKSVVVQNSDLNHGIAAEGTSIYASTAATVFRYTWDPNTHTVTGNPQTIVTGMNQTIEHRTRTLQLSGQSLLVSGGSSDDLDQAVTDPSNGAGQIRRFALNSVPGVGWTWLQGDLIAWGMRNSVGITLSSDGSKLWTVENSADGISYTTQGGQQVDINQDNPAEELNVVNLSEPAHYYGFPSCFTSWNIRDVVSGSSLGVGGQFSVGSNSTDAQCQDPTFNVPPRLTLQAHTAPLDIAFYRAPSESDVAVNRDFNDHAFVSFHGSSSRDPPVGYGIVRIPWSGDAPEAAADSDDGYSYLIQASNLEECPGNCFRPVGVAFDTRGRLFGSSDSTGEIFIVQSGSLSSAKLTFTTLLLMGVVGFATIFLLG